MKTPELSPSRRGFMQGDWSSQGTQPRSSWGSIEVVSLIVNAWPLHLPEVEHAIKELGDAEVHARDVARGKLIVVLEAATQAEIGAKANVISGLPHVLSSVMVFQASEDGQGVS